MDRVLGQRLVSELPPSMLVLMSRISFCIAGFSWPTPTISNACTSGMPEASMVASCRLKIAMSPAVILPPPLNSLCCLRTLVGTMFCRRKSARADCSFTARIFPRILLPFLSLPSQVNGVSLGAATAVGGMATVVL